MNSNPTTLHTSEVSTNPSPAAAEAEPAGRGRPTVLTPELVAEIYKLIRAYGLTDSRAGILAGASTSSLSRWKATNEEFRDYLEMARAEFEFNRTLKLLEATRADGSPDWRAHAWLLKNSQRKEATPRPGRPRKVAEPAATEKTPEIPENRPAPATPSPATQEHTQKIPENQPAAKNAAPTPSAPPPRQAEKIPENHPASATVEREEAALSSGRAA